MPNIHQHPRPTTPQMQTGGEEMGSTDLQIRARMSPLPVAKRPPVGLGATEITVTMTNKQEGLAS
jgi:hypothetical protein